MDITIDTSVVVAVILRETSRDRLIEVTAGATLHTPASIHWEIGDSLSSFFKQNRLSLEQAVASIDGLREIEYRSHNVDLKTAIELSHARRIYAYDTYVLAVAMKTASPLLTLDRGLRQAAIESNVPVLEIPR